MTITAKYASQCAVCARKINPGEKIEWRKGEGSTHVACIGNAREPLNSRPISQMISADADLAALAAQHGRTLEGTPALRSMMAGAGEMRVGEVIVRTRGKGETARRVRMLVVAVAAARYYSASYLEDMDMFDMRAGRYQDVQLIDVTATQQEDAADMAKDIAKTRKAEVERILRTSYSAESHLTGKPEGVTTTSLLAESRMGGSEQFLLGSDGIVYYMRSDYDMGPMWWVSSATTELIAEAKALGVRP